MPLPYFIEYIESLRGPQGRLLAQHSDTQRIIPITATGARIQFNLFPPFGTHAYIIYGIDFGDAMVPAAWAVEILHAGSNIFIGTVTALVIRRGVNCYLEATQAQRLYCSGQNTSALNQYFECIFHYCVAVTETDLRLIREAMEDLRTGRMTVRQRVGV